MHRTMSLTQKVYVWKNCEYRTYQFKDTAGTDDDAWLMETPESWKRRRGEETPPTPAEQDQWKRTVYKELEPIYAAMGYA